MDSIFRLIGVVLLLIAIDLAIIWPTSRNWWKASLAFTASGLFLIAILTS